MITVKDSKSGNSIADFQGAVSSRFLVREKLVFRCGNFTPNIQNISVIDTSASSAELSFYNNTFIKQLLDFLKRGLSPILIKSETGYGQASYLTAVFFMLMGSNEIQVLNNAFYDGNYTKESGTLFKRIFNSHKSMIINERKAMQNQLTELLSKYNSFTDFLEKEYLLTAENIKRIQNNCLEEMIPEFDLPDYARIRMLVKGRVQGVGFRGFVTSKADNLCLTGFVENLDDGSVLIEAQGDGFSLSSLMTHIKNGNSFIMVSSLEYEQINMVASEKKFSYRFSEYDM